MAPRCTPQEAETRFWSKVDKTGECWLWKAGLYANGYGQFSVNKAKVYAHRFAWQAATGEQINGKIICHTCDVRACVNPAHLFSGTQLDNMRDMRSKGRDPQSHMTACKRGHAFTIENTRIDNTGGRQCRTCDMIRSLRSRQRHTLRRSAA